MMVSTISDLIRIDQILHDLSGYEDTFIDNFFFRLHANAAKAAVKSGLIDKDVYAYFDSHVAYAATLLELALISSRHDDDPSITFRQLFLDSARERKVLKLLNEYLDK